MTVVRALGRTAEGPRRVSDVGLAQLGLGVTRPPPAEEVVGVGVGVVVGVGAEGGPVTEVVVLSVAPNVQGDPGVNSTLHQGVL